MGLFGKKKEEVTLPPVAPQNIDFQNAPVNNYPVENFEKQISKMPEPKSEPILEIPRPAPIVQKSTEVVEEEERPKFAPLFIKLDRYKHILNSMSELKKTVGAIRNALSLMNELEKLKVDNLKLLQVAVEKFDRKIVDLDSEFIRPSGFSEESREYMKDQSEAESLERVLSDLKSQVGQLRRELDSIS